MKILRQGLVFLGTFYLSLACIVGRVNFHQIFFINEACIKPYRQYTYHTCDALRVKIDGKAYVVPKNFKTDLASIPRFLWSIFAPQYSGFMAPAILHDYLYRCNRNITREFADEVFYSALIVQDVNSFTAAEFYLAVRLFGHYHFGNGDC